MTRTRDEFLQAMRTFFASWKAPIHSFGSRPEEGVHFVTFWYPPFDPDAEAYDARDVAEAVAAMADHQDPIWPNPGPWLSAAPTTRLPLETDMAPKDTAITALWDLADVWQNATNGMGPDGAFVDVSGPRREGAPAFPRLLVRMLTTHANKTQSYVGAADPLSNYVNAGHAIGVAGWAAAYMRLVEKLNRVQGLFDHPRTPEDDEAVSDTLIDIAVLALLVHILRGENR